MNFLLHNRIEISNGHSQVYFYNSMLKSVLQQIGAKQSYNDFIALGQEVNEDYSKANCKLSNHLKSYKLAIYQKDGGYR